MATIIDALLVTLGMDASGFKKGTDDAKKAQEDLTAQSKKDGKEMEALHKKAATEQAARAKKFQEQGDKAAHTFGKIREHALSLIGVLAGGVGLVEFAKFSVLGAAAAGRLSDNLGMGIKDLQGWEYAARSVGATSGDMARSLESAGAALANMKYNGVVSPQMEAFFRFGGGQFGMPKNGADMMKDEVAMVSKIYAAGHHMEALTRWEHMGNSEATFNLAKHGLANFERLKREGEAKAAFTRAEANAAEVLQKKLNDLLTTVNTVLVRIGFALLPVFTALVNKFKDWSNWALTHESTVRRWAHIFAVDLVDGVTKLWHWMNLLVPQLEKFGAWVSASMPGLERFWGQINKQVQAWGGWKDVLIAFAGAYAAIKIGSMAASLLLLAKALTGVGGGLASVAAGSGALAVLGGVAGYAALLKISPTANIPGQMPNPIQVKATKEASDAMAMYNSMPLAQRSLMATLSKRYNIPLPYTIAQLHQENATANPLAWSPGHKSHGLFQFTKPTWETYGHGALRTDPMANIRAYYEFMAHLRKLHPGNPAAAYAAYNGSGPAATAYGQNVVSTGSEIASERHFGTAVHTGLARTSFLPGAAQSTAVQNSVTHHAVHNESHSEAHIGTVAIHTNAVDAAGIAKDVRWALGKHLIPQANTGLS
jgi:hypothetical protein